MRPVKKSSWPQYGGQNKKYKPHTIAKPDLENDIGTYCSYCEVYSSDLEVEHVISQNQDDTKTHDWNNFLVACGRCNGANNKGNKPVDLDKMHFPHKNNTMLSFEYLEGGYVQLNSALTGNSKQHAENMLNLVGLDKCPGRPGYSTNDRRWADRRLAWEYAVKLLADFKANKLTALQVAEFAIQRGFFSVWFTVFEKHIAVKRELVNAFKGTALNCFDVVNGFGLLNRNPAKVNDMI